MDMTLLTITNLWPPFIPADISGGAPMLVVGSCESIVTSESPTLTPHYVLVIGDSACVVTSDNATLEEHPFGELSVQSSVCIVESDNVTLVVNIYSTVILQQEFMLGA